MIFFTFQIIQSMINASHVVNYTKICFSFLWWNKQFTELAVYGLYYWQSDFNL